MRHFLVCLVIVAGFSGCLVADEPAPPADPGLMAAAPTWQMGDWWTYRWESEIYGFSFEATVVVGNVSDDGYGVGMDLEAYELNALLFHLPAVGPLTKELGYAVHEVLFEPVRFPLYDNKTWETRYVAATVNLTARAAAVATPDGTTPGFRITNAGHEELAGRTYTMEYAPSAGWFTLLERVDLDGRLRERITLVAHGSGHEGTVRVPGDIEILFLDARGGDPTAAVPPALPVASFDPPDELDMVFVACLYGDAPGAYEVEVASARGTGCQNRGMVTADDVTRRIAQAEVANVVGPWDVRFVTAGQGLAIAEVLGYTVTDVTLGAA